MPEKTMPEKDDRTTKVMEAVIACIQKYGIQKVTMDDVAEMSGISRITLYREFGNKQRLFTGVLDYRGKQFNSKIKELIENAQSLEEALELYFLTTCRASVKDESIKAMVETHYVFRAVLDAKESPLKQSVSDVWLPAIRKSHVERYGHYALTKEDETEMIDWLIIMQANFSRMIIESAIDEEQIRRYLRRFVIPVFLQSPQNLPCDVR